MKVNKKSICYMIRKELGLSRPALAKMLGKQTVTVWAYEYETIRMPESVKQNLMMYYSLFLDITGKKSIM